MDSEVNIGKINQVYHAHGWMAAAALAESEKFKAAGLDYVAAQIRAYKWNPGPSPKAAVSPQKEKPAAAPVPAIYNGPKYFDHRVVDRVKNEDSTKVLVKVTNCRNRSAPAEYDVRHVDADGKIVRTEHLGAVSLDEARRRIGKVIVHPQVPGYGKPTNVPQAHKGPSLGKGDGKKAAAKGKKK